MSKLNEGVWNLSVPGAPVVKERPRVFGRHAVTPRKTMDAETAIRAAWMGKYPTLAPIVQDVHLWVVFYMPDRKRRDVDNLAKLVQDALNGLAYEDDSQIVHLDVWKVYPSKKVPGRGGKPRKRRKGDVLVTESGRAFDPHTEVTVCLASKERW